MKIFEYLRAYPELFWPPVVAAVCLAVLCAWLSVLVVLKRLAFIGQGISHAGFGGIGIAAVLGLAASQMTPGGAVAQFGVVLAFCVAAALAVGFLAPGEGSRAGGTHEDTAIGIVLVVSMALGSILVRAYAPTFRWEDFLFGYLMNTGWVDAAVAAVVTAAVVTSVRTIDRPRPVALLSSKPGSRLRPSLMTRILSTPSWLSSTTTTSPPALPSGKP